MRAPVCPDCGYIHTSTDARAVGRFTSTPTYVAATAGTPARSTREQAESDECAGRRRPADVIAVQAAPKKVVEPTEEPALFTPAELSPPVIEFPAAAMENAARAKAWRDFLAQVRLSLLVWEVDATVRAECEYVVDWIRRCRDDLLFGGVA